MTIHTAWAEDAEAFDPAAHARTDFPVRSLVIEGVEGEAPTCRVVLEPVAGGWLAPSRPRWAFVSYTPPGASAAVLLFRGRLIGAPSDVSGALVELMFDARNTDHQERLASALAPFKTAPHFDPLFIDSEREDDPVEVLDGWHRVVDVRRTDGAVTIVDALVGQRSITIPGGRVEGATVRYRATGAPLPAVTVRAEAQWTQRREDAFDLGGLIMDRLRGPIRTLNEPHLFADAWPKPDSRLGGRGWRVGESRLVPETAPGHDFQWFPRATAFNTWWFRDQIYRPICMLHWIHEQRRVERLDMTLTGRAQPLASEGTPVETLDLRVRDVAEPLADGECPPLGDPARASFWQTARGREAAAHVLLVAAVRIAASQRCVEVTARIPGWPSEALALGTDAQATLHSPHLPSGRATGKVFRYALRADGGRLEAEITIACSIGVTSAPSHTPGTPVYAIGWAGPDWQRHAGATTPTGPDSPPLPDYSEQMPTAGAVDLPSWGPEDLITGLELVNVAGEQRAVLSDPDWRRTLGGRDAHHWVNTDAVSYVRFCRRDLNPVDDADHVITVAVPEPYGRGPGINLEAE